MVEIKPGVELDRAVAEAAEPWCTVGMCASSGCIDIPVSEIGDDPDVLAVWKWDGERNWRKLPKFSTDLNAAFAAAEKVGLFHRDRDAFLCRTPYGKKGSGEEWKVWCEQKGKLRYECSHHGSTPALAICAAILKLKEVEHD